MSSNGGPGDTGGHEAASVAVPDPEADTQAHGSFVAALPETGRDAVLGAAKPRVYRDRDTLIRQGDEARSLFMIESGRVVIRFDTPAGDSLLLGILGPGDVFGEVGLLDGRSERSASAQAVGEVVVRVLRQEDFDRLRRTNPDVNDFVMLAMARQVQRLTRLVAEALYVPVERRVARRLYEVARAFAGETWPVVVPLTQEELAQLAGTTRPTANQALKKLESVGVLRLSRGRVELLDGRTLRERCGWT